MKMKRTLALCLTLVICASLAIGGTMAYLQDTDSDVNVMTMGSVYIEQIESSRGENGELVPFVNPNAMMPAVYDELTKDENGFWQNVNGAIDKIVTVENTGRSDAYVRTFIAVPSHEMANNNGQAIVLNYSNSAEWSINTNAVAQIKVNDVQYNVYQADYVGTNGKLAKGDVTDPSLLQILLSKHATNDDVEALIVSGSQAEIYVLSQAVQVEGFENAAAAFKASFQGGEELNADMVQGWLNGIAPSESNFVNSVEDLNKAIEDGAKKIILGSGSYKLTKDVVGAQLIIDDDANVEIDLNGKIISNDFHKSEGAVISNDGVLKLVGGVVSSTGNNGGSALVNNGLATVEGTTLNGAPNADGSWPAYTVNNTGVLTLNDAKITSYHGSVASYGTNALVTLNDSEIDMKGIPGFTNHGIYTYNNGKVRVNGGTYANKAADQNATGGSVINGDVTITAGTFSGRIENYYGNPSIKGGTFSVNPKANFIANGYEAVDNGNGTWTVSAQKASTPVDNNSALKDALSNGENVELNTDVAGAGDESNAYGATSLNIKNGQTVEGNGNNYSGNNKFGTWDSVISTTGGLIKDLTVSNAMRGIFVNHNSTHSEPVVLENVVFDNVVYTISCDQGTGKGLTATNCTINGWTSYAATIGNVEFINCSFGEGQGYAYCRPYAPTVFVGCDFAQGYEIDARDTVMLQNCTYNGQKITDENIDSLGLISGGMSKVTVK